MITPLATTMYTNNRGTSQAVTSNNSHHKIPVWCGLPSGNQTLQLKIPELNAHL
jgi:hypothetical protein